MKRNALILTEAGDGIGLGHLSRCQAWMAGLEEKGFTVSLQIAKAINEEWLDPQMRAALLQQCRGSVLVVVDSYLATQSLIDDIAVASRVPVFLDDDHRHAYYRGFVINGAIGVTAQDYQAVDGVEYLCGIRYFPLRNEFWDFQDYQVRQDVRSVLISMGGADGKGMTRFILEKLKQSFDGLKVHVVLGKFQKDGSIVNDFGSAAVIFHSNRSAQQMRTLFHEADILITSAGQTLYESARIGTPALVVLTAENQRRNVMGWQEQGAISFAGAWDDVALSQALASGFDWMRDHRTREGMSKKARENIDGQGIRRAIKEILEKSNAASIH